jgi:TonB family protein
VSVFDASGKLLRTGTGFFISEDGQFIASRSLVEGGVNAIANTADKKIYNVAGVLAESPELDLAVLKAETKQVPFLPLSKPVAAEDGARVAVIGSPLSRREGKVSEGTITARRTDDKGEWLDLSTPIENDAAGSPVLTERGEVLGIVTSDRSKNPPVNTVLASATVQSFLAKIDPAATAQWAGASPSPTKSPKVRRKIVFRRSPTYPTTVDARALRGSGSYRIIFDATGRAKNVQIVRSTGGEAFDRAAVTALQQWRSEPGQEWSIVIPVSFQPRAN